MDDVDHVLIELHDGMASGHFSGEMTIQKVLRVGYYCPTLLKNAHSYARRCQIFQVNAGKKRRPTFPLPLVMVQDPLEQ